VKTEFYDPTSSVATGVLCVGAVKVRFSRLDCIDLLRGAVMILMALDHVRDFFTGPGFSPEDLAHTSGPLFLTRFVTHFCAPVFFLLAGTGGYLSLARGKSVAEVSRFFWTRGLWLVLISLTLTTYAWTFVFFRFWHGGVLWALGWSMVAMALIVRLPVRWIAAIGVGTIVLHNVFDWVSPARFGRFAAVWLLLHEHGLVLVAPGKTALLIDFPLLPWLGVMAAGYALGALLSRGNWRKTVFTIGVLLTITFLILRIFHLYGNGNPSLQPWAGDAAGPWRVQSSLTMSVVSFLDTLKFPPSLQFLLMTLGPALMALAWLDTVNIEHAAARAVRVFGRVPFFYYILHLYLIHSLAVWVGVVMHQPVAWLLHGAFMLQLPPPTYGHGLLFIYAMWITSVALLYLPCKVFMEFKQQHPNWWWLRYL
jgi:uncharacterized membrane protein